MQGEIKKERKENVIEVRVCVCVREREKEKGRAYENFLCRRKEER